MSKVYFIENDTKDYSELSGIAVELLKSIEEDTDHKYEKIVPIKVHFGEKGNRTFLPEDCYLGVINHLKDKGVEPSYIESNVLYRGARTTTSSHLKLAREHGFTSLPIIIADGETGTEYDEVEINKEYFDVCKIGKAYGNYSQFIVMSHFKGHAMAGFGGALKQLSMGFAARSGKMAQHSSVSPVISKKKCISCGLCIEKCNFDAITMDGTAVIDDEKCTGCAGCIAVCPEGAIRNRWDSKSFLYNLAEYAYGAAKGKDNIYISYLVNLTVDCDCIGKHLDTVHGNIGVMASKDPVALDAASLDILQRESGKNHFDKGRITLEHAEKIGLGTREYELIKL
ncbi:hypothetical protein SAMN02745751_02187 [Dethiosulfatibacter aminovorans DSM 17477]|uniref:4Fe-4S ferredoxin-type domain-containing protein n=1 Tax=Dethiosulfatibacter aminovorans DSM 17477 TaxID=1121476 RepID=A0A1M6I261_9FIRM|nr:DUF362 domain-containing protein [Dethiosulfatibacter aminovorans]SHJ28569.1 hypothetical protein SAMN02745751_02187 [Dethiosulfatibacter aminovorans DSM 17477]